MGKREKKTKFQVAHRDQVERMNYLYQAANLLASLKPNQNLGGYEPISRYYNLQMKEIGRKIQVRLDKRVKGTVCKRCNNPLLPHNTELKLQIFKKDESRGCLEKVCGFCSTRRKVFLQGLNQPKLVNRSKQVEEKQEGGASIEGYQFDGEKFIKVEKLDPVMVEKEKVEM